MDPQYAGHSLRAGLATSAAAAGISERAIMAQTDHRSGAWFAGISGRLCSGERRCRSGAIGQEIVGYGESI